MLQYIESERYKISDKDSRIAFEYSLEKLLKAKLNRNQPLIILCIGSHYVMGDCLGPLI